MNSSCERIRISVLGAGTWGIALARVLSLNGHEVTVWSKFPSEAEALDRTREAPNLPGVRIPGDIRFTSDPAALMKRRTERTWHPFTQTAAVPKATASLTTFRISCGVASGFNRV